MDSGVVRRGGSRAVVPPTETEIPCPLESRVILIRIKAVILGMG